MTAKKASAVPPEKLERYKKLIAGIPGLELKGATMPYTSFNGHMSSFLNKEGNLALRLPETERNEFIKKFKTTLAEQHNTVLKEYVAVPESAFTKTAEMRKYFNESFKYVSSLKPKSK